MRTFAGTLDSLEPIRTYVRDAATGAGLDSGATYRLCLAVDEVATNIVMHGYEEQGMAGSIDVESAIEDDALVVRLYDTSAEYDPDDHDVPAHELAAPLETRVEGGLGLYLVRANVDEFFYEREDGRNRHDFRVRLA